MNGPVICALDGIDGAGVAGVARDLAERYELPLLFVRVLDGSECPGEPADGEITIVGGDPADRLVTLAGEHAAQFLVLGNGPLPSVGDTISADVSRRAPCPVLLVSPEAARTELYGATPCPEVDGGIIRFGLTRS